jgi:hypothetical protein
LCFRNRGSANSFVPLLADTINLTVPGIYQLSLGELSFTVAFQGLTIQDNVANAGDADQGSGGGIRAQGAARVVLNHIILQNNTTTADGSGIALESIGNAGIGTLTNCPFTWRSVPTANLFGYQLLVWRTQTGKEAFAWTVRQS